MDRKCTNDTRFYYNKDLDENLAQLTQKTEDPKSNKGNLTHPLPPPSRHTERVNVIEMKSIKKEATPHFYINSHFSGLSSFLAKHFVKTLPVTQFFEGPTGGWFQLCLPSGYFFTFVR